MTRDPERWLSVGSDADGFERELLKSIHDVSPRARAKDEAWTRIAAQMSAVALVTGGATAAASHAAASGAATAVGTGVKSGLVAFSQSLAAKVVLGVAVAGAGAFVAARQIESRGVPAPMPQQASARAVERAFVAQAPAPAAAAAVPRVESEPPAERSPPSSVEPSEPSRAPAKRAAKDDIAAESSRLAEARAELRRGNPRAAQAILTRLRAEFPKGALGQEREVLAIEVLAAEGNRAAAKRRVQAFVTAHPNSPHNAALARFLGD